jgi:DNA-binding Xre family transcriptional regulator
MQRQTEKIEVEIVKRIYKLFLTKFDGNKSEFARASLCSETTVRRIFKNEQRVTLELLLRMCVALEVEVIELFDKISTKKL